MSDETTNTSQTQLVDLAGLQYFYGQLRTKFYPRSSADAKFALIGGSTSTSFSANAFKVYSSTNHVDLTFDAANNALVITSNSTGGVYSITIPFTSGGDTVITNANTYAQTFVNSGTAYLKAVVPNVFNQFIGLDSTTVNGTAVLNFGATDCNVGSILCAYPGSAAANARLFVVTSVDASGTPTAVQDIGAPAPCSIYYDRDTQKFYIFNVGSGFQIISTEYVVGELGGDDTEIATSVQIANMITYIDSHS